MELDHGICYRALQARDGRFDGRFFTGVTSTGVYCRPVCPARTPRPENCVFFACAAAAEEAGFRACRRCRPETAPGTPAWQGTSATVSRALRLIADGALDDGKVEDLTGRLGVGARHLRRLFGEQLGVSPLAVARTRRVHLARQLIESTPLAMGQIAQAAGFANVRRFNAAIRRSFDRTPTAIRSRAAGPETDSGRVHLRLAYRPPLDWAALLEFLGPRAIPGVESVADGVYHRSIEVGGFVGTIAVAATPDGGDALLLTAPVAAAPCLGRIVGRVRAQFDLDADPAVIAEQLGRNERLGSLTRRHPGLRIPGAWDGFEVAVRAICGQQVTVAGATRLAGRLVERFGTPLPEGAGRVRPDCEVNFLFPAAGRLASCKAGEIAAVGMPGARAATIGAVAKAACDSPSLLEPAAGIEVAVRRWTALPGIGDWTAQYVAMRALGEPDAFPAGDLGLRKMLAAGGTLPTPAAVRRLAEAWRPWRSYAALLLWRELSTKDRKGSP